MLLDPRMIERRVVGHEVEHQPQAALRSRSRSRASAASPPRSAMHGVAGDREPGTGDVLLAQVRQRLLELPPPLRVGCATPAARPGPSARRSGTRSSRSPCSARRSSSASGMSSSVAGRPRAPGQLRQPDARVDLIERRIGGVLVHVAFAPAASLAVLFAAASMRRLAALEQLVRVDAWSRRAASSWR